jgi:hypothetical protein
MDEMLLTGRTLYTCNVVHTSHKSVGGLLNRSHVKGSRFMDRSFWSNASCDIENREGRDGSDIKCFWQNNKMYR